MSGSPARKKQKSGTDNAVSSGSPAGLSSSVGEASGGGQAPVYVQNVFEMMSKDPFKDMMDLVTVTRGGSEAFFQFSFEYYMKRQWNIITDVGREAKVYTMPNSIADFLFKSESGNTIMELKVESKNQQGKTLEQKVEDDLKKLKSVASTESVKNVKRLAVAITYEDETKKAMKDVGHMKEFRHIDLKNGKKLILWDKYVSDGEEKNGEQGGEQGGGQQGSVREGVDANEKDERPDEGKGRKNISKEGEAEEGLASGQPDSTSSGGKQTTKGKGKITTTTTTKTAASERPWRNNSGTSSSPGASNTSNATS